MENLPKELVVFFGGIWSKEKRQLYFSQKRDFSSAYDLIVAGMEMGLKVEDLQEQIELCMPQYLKDPYWDEQNHPAYGLFTQFNKFQPRVKKKFKASHLSAFECPNCTSDTPVFHKADELCPLLESVEVERDMAKVLKPLTDKFGG